MSTEALLTELDSCLKVKARHEMSRHVGESQSLIRFLS
jgi:hypothetical protein